MNFLTRHSIHKKIFLQIICTFFEDMFFLGHVYTSLPRSCYTLASVTLEGFEQLAVKTPPLQHFLVCLERLRWHFLRGQFFFFFFGDCQQHYFKSSEQNSLQHSSSLADLMADASLGWQTVREKLKKKK